jgi:hypothetical protein
MKKILSLVAASLVAAFLPAHAQFGPGGGQGPSFDGAFNKLFGDNQAFIARVEIQTPNPMGGSNDMVMPGKLSFDGGKSRFEMNVTEMRGIELPPMLVQQFKSMGMDAVVQISRPDLKVDYVVYPGLKSYAESPSTDTSAAASPDDFKIETTELGSEAVSGHDCVKNKVVVTDKGGNKHESTVWNATDLKKFPVKIVTSEAGKSVTMVFKSVSLTAPAATAFEAPTALTKYADVQTLVQTEMTKHMSGALGKPPGQQ